MPKRKTKNRVARKTKTKQEELNVLKDGEKKDDVNNLFVVDRVGDEQGRKKWKNKVLTVHKLLGISGEEKKADKSKFSELLAEKTARAISKHSLPQKKRKREKSDKFDLWEEETKQEGLLFPFCFFFFGSILHFFPFKILYSSFLFFLSQKGLWESGWRRCRKKLILRRRNTFPRSREQ